jgi:hypothetical protein
VDRGLTATNNTPTGGMFGFQAVAICAKVG